MAATWAATSADAVVAVVALVVTIGAPPLLRVLSGARLLSRVPASIREIGAQGTLLLGSCLITALGLRRVTPLLALPWRAWRRDVARFLFATLALGGVWWTSGSPGSSRGTFVFAGAVHLLAPALSEEIVYRGILPLALDRAVAWAIADRAGRFLTVALLSSLAFGAAHQDSLGTGSEVALALVHALAGLAFFALRGETGSLLSPMLAHAAYNGLVTSAMR